MGLRIIYGRSGSGKTKLCLDEIKSKLSDNDTLIFVVPEQFSFQAEKELVKNSNTGGVLKNEVLSFRRLCYRIFNQEGGITYPHIHPAGKAMILQNIIENNKDNFRVFNKIYSKQGFIEIISNLITEFKRYDVKVLDLKNVLEKLNTNQELRQKISEICMIYEEFENSINEKYTDTDDELTMAAKRLKDSNMFKDTNIWIDGFLGYTKQEYNMIEVLLKKAKTVTITFCLDKLCDSGKIDPVDTFAESKRAYQKIISIARQNNVKIENIIYKEHIYKFYDNAELSFLEKNYSSYPYDIYNEKTENISINIYADIFDEIQDVAKKIIKLCQEGNYRYKDIAIITRDMKLYQKMLEVVLKEYNIPYFVDKKFEMSNNNLIRFIISVMEIFTENWSYETVFNALKTGFFGIEREKIDKLENYVLACGIKGSKWTNKTPWNMMPYFMPTKKEQDNEEILKELNEVRDIIVTPLMNFREKNNEKKTAKEFCKDLYDLLCDLNIPAQIEKIVDEFNKRGNLDRASEYGQVFNVFMDFLDQIVEVQENDKMTIRKFLSILKTGIKEYNLGVIPMGQDQVLVGTVERSKSHNIKVMYLLGVNDGIFPAKGVNEGILSDNDRHILEDNNIIIAKDTKIQAFDEQFLIYQTLTVPSKILHISYSIKDFSGKSLRPSIIISRLKKIFPNIKTVSNVIKSVSFDGLVSKPQIFNELIKQLKNKLHNRNYDEKWDSIYKWFSNDEFFGVKCNYIKNAFKYENKEKNLSKKSVRALYGENLTESVSRLEKFTECPFGFYVKYGLKVKERKIYKLTPPDIGTFLHAVIDIFSKEVSKGEHTWRTFDATWCENRVSEIVDEMLDKMKGQVIISNKRYVTLIKRLKRVITKTIWLIAKQIRDSSFNPLDYEVGFGENDKYPPIEITLETGQKIKLIGRIDRVDKFQYGDKVYIRIIDYKSYNKKFKLQDLFYGLQIQLITYLDAMWETDEKIKPAGMLYLKLEDPIIKGDSNLTDEEIEEEIFKSLKMNGLVLKDKDIIKGMDNTIEEQGTSLYIPASIKKSGEIGKKTSGASDKEFMLLREYTKKLLKDLCKEIVNGNVEISPYKQKNKTACDYCKFLPICQFDKDKNNFRIFSDISDLKVWDSMNKTYDKQE